MTVNRVVCDGSCVKAKREVAKKRKGAQEQEKQPSSSSLSTSNSSTPSANV